MNALANDQARRVATLIHSSVLEPSVPDKTPVGSNGAGGTGGSALDPTDAESEERRATAGKATATTWAIITDTVSNSWSAYVLVALRHTQLRPPHQIHGYPGVTATSTALTMSPASPVAPGNPVTLTATVTPAEAAGTVQFKDGTINIGNPVAVRNGTVSGTTSLLTIGSHQLTAVFTPTNPATYGPSTSPAATFVVTTPTGR